MPEGDLALAQAVVYLCMAPKSNALYTAYGAVHDDVEKTAQDPVPLHLRNAPTGLMKSLGYAKGYQYAHDLDQKVADMECLPNNLRSRRYYHPTEEGIEKRIKARLEEIRQVKANSSQRHSDTEKKRSKSPEED
jgi:putative ATPase